MCIRDRYCAIGLSSFINIHSCNSSDKLFPHIFYKRRSKVVAGCIERSGSRRSFRATNVAWRRKNILEYSSGVDVFWFAHWSTVLVLSPVYWKRYLGRVLWPSSMGAKHVRNDNLTNSCTRQFTRCSPCGVAVAPLYHKTNSA